MGNAESSSQFPPYKDDDDNLSSRRKQSRNYGEEEEENKSSAAFKVAAVAGTALLALGASYLAATATSDDSDGRRKAAAQGFSSPGSSSGSSGFDRTLSAGGRVSEGRHDSGGLRGFNNQGSGLQAIKIMSYNVWFREDVELDERMKAIGNLIQQHNPDIIFFQEVTPRIYSIFQSSNWWEAYKCSVSPLQATRRYFCMLLSKLPVDGWRNIPLQNSTMGRELCAAQVDVGRGKKLIVATSHLESPTPPMMHSMDRASQAKQVLNILNSSTDVIFGGDMNWDEDTDGPFPRLEEWVDAWTQLRPRENGWTYDTKSNLMLTGNRPLQKRLDRFMCKLQNFKLLKVEMIGMEEIPGISYYNKRKILPVLPSDHYGLLLTVCAIY